MVKLSSIKFRWNIHSIFLLLLLILNVSTTYGDDEMTDEKTLQGKKTLYLHVGPSKTGTTTIQLECRDNRPKLKERGVLYPESVVKEEHHHNVVYLAMRDQFEELDQYILRIKEQSKDYDCVLLSSEVVAYAATYMTPKCEHFLESLRKHFAVKILYCDRVFADRVASLAAYYAVVTEPFEFSLYESVDDFLKSEKEKDDKLKQFFTSQGARFLSFEDLKKSNTLVESFLKKGLGITIDIPDSRSNTMESMIGGAERSIEDLRKLESVYNVPANTFVHAWEQGKEEGMAKFAKLIADLTKKRALALYGTPAPQSAPVVVDPAPALAPVNSVCNLFRLLLSLLRRQLQEMLFLRRELCQQESLLQK